MISTFRVRSGGAREATKNNRPSSVEWLCSEAVDQLIFGDGNSYSLDLSHGTNRLAPPRHFAELLVRGLSDRRLVSEYTAPLGPDSLRQAVARYEAARASEVSASNIAITHGATEALDFVWRYAVHTGRRRLLVLGPQFPTVWATADSVGLDVFVALGDRLRHYDLKLSEIQTAIELVRPDIIVLSQPTNPSGWVFDSSAVAAICDIAARWNCWIVVDRVCGDIVSPSFPRQVGNFVIEGGLRGADVYVVDSFSKRRSIPGLRTGYLVAPSVAIRWIGKSLAGRTVSTVPMDALIYDLEATSDWHDHLVLTTPPPEYVGEIWQNHAVCLTNRIAALEKLEPWLARSSDHVAGINCALTLRWKSRAADLQIVRALLRHGRLASYPISCFAPGLGRTRRSEFDVRMTLSSGSYEFTKTIEVLRSILEVCGETAVE